MVTYMDFTSPSVQFTYDLKNNNFFTKDSQNLINGLGVQQLNTLGNTSLLDIYLSKSNVVEPHIHQNASEVVYCISGAAIVSLINPFTKKLINLPITPGMVANVPQGWWHYEIATEDKTHLLAIFDAPTPEVILGSDILRLTPASVFAHTYCLNEAMVKETFAPITNSVIIGPPNNCVNGKPTGINANIGHGMVPGYYNQPTSRQEQRPSYGQQQNQAYNQQQYTPAQPNNQLNQDAHNRQNVQSYGQSYETQNGGQQWNNQNTQQPRYYSIWER